MRRLKVNILLVLAASGCQQRQPFQEATLTNNGQGKYWDIIHSTDIYGRIHQDIVSSYRRRNGTMSSVHLEECVYLTAGGKAIHYRNRDSVTVIDKGADTDIKFNPDTFTLRDSTLTLSGNSYKVLTLTPQVLVLEYEYQKRKARSVYIPSRYQRKVVTATP